MNVKHATLGTFLVIGYVAEGGRIEALLLAEECEHGLRSIGRVEFWRASVLDDDAREALAFLTRASPCVRMHSGQGVFWTEPRLVATVRHFGRTRGAIRAGLLQELSVLE